MEMKPDPLLALATLFLLWLLSAHIAHSTYHPKSAQFYLHDTIFAKDNHSNTAVLVAAPGGKLDALSDGLFHFGATVVFDDALTKGPAITSKRVGTAQGMYVYTGRSNISAIWAFTAFLDTEAYNGSLSFMGGEFILKPTRDLPVVGGTGDFEMARGIATISTVKFTGTTYFALFFNVSLAY